MKQRGSGRLVVVGGRGRRSRGGGVAAEACACGSHHGGAAAAPWIGAAAGPEEAAAGCGPAPITRGRGCPVTNRGGGSESEWPPWKAMEKRSWGGHTLTGSPCHDAHATLFSSFSPSPPWLANCIVLKKRNIRSRPATCTIAQQLGPYLGLV